MSMHKKEEVSSYRGEKQDRSTYLSSLIDALPCSQSKKGTENMSWTVIARAGGKWDRWLSRWSFEKKLSSQEDPKSENVDKIVFISRLLCLRKLVYLDFRASTWLRLPLALVIFMLQRMKVVPKVIRIELSVLNSDSGVIQAFCYCDSDHSEE